MPCEERARGSVNSSRTAVTFLRRKCHEVDRSNEGVMKRTRVVRQVKLNYARGLRWGMKLVSYLYNVIGSIARMLEETQYHLIPPLPPPPKKKEQQQGV